MGILKYGKFIVIGIIVMFILIAAIPKVVEVAKGPPEQGEIPITSLGIYTEEDAHWRYIEFPEDENFIVIGKKSKDGGRYVLTLVSEWSEMEASDLTPPKEFQILPCDQFEIEVDSIQLQKYVKGGVFSGAAICVMETAITIKMSDYDIIAKAETTMSSDWTVKSEDDVDERVSKIRGGEAFFRFKRVSGVSADDAFTPAEEIERVLKLANSANSARQNQIYIPVDIQKYVSGMKKNTPLSAKPSGPAGGTDEGMAGAITDPVGGIIDFEENDTVEGDPVEGEPGLEDPEAEEEL